MKSRNSHIIKKRKHLSQTNLRPSSIISHGLYSHSNFIDIPDKLTFLPYTKLSSSANSSIYVVMNTLNNNTYIKKVIDLTITPNYKDSIERLKQVHQKLKHKNILRLYNVHKENNIINIYYQYAHKGNLEDLILKTKFGFKEEIAFVYFYKILKCIEYIHKEKIILSNLSPKKILLDKDDQIYIYDFIQSKNYSKFYDYSEDIWNLGVVLLVMVQGISNEQTPQIKKFVSEDCADLIRILLKGNNNKYKCIKDVLNHKWIRKYIENPQYKYLEYEYEGDMDDDMKSIKTSRKYLLSEINDSKLYGNFDTRQSSNETFITYRNNNEIDFDLDNDKFFDTVDNVGNDVNKRKHLSRNNNNNTNSNKRSFWESFTGCFSVGCNYK